MLNHRRFWSSPPETFNFSGSTQATRAANSLNPRRPSSPSWRTSLPRATSRDSAFSAQSQRSTSTSTKSSAKMKATTLIWMPTMASTARRSHLLCTMGGMAREASSICTTIRCTARRAMTARMATTAARTSGPAYGWGLSWTSRKTG